MQAEETCCTKASRYLTVMCHRLHLVNDASNLLCSKSTRNGSLNNKRRGEVLRFIGPLLFSYLPSLALVHPGIFGVCVLLVARWALMTKIACLAYRHRVKQSSLLSPSCSYFRSPFSRPATLFKGLQDTLVLEADVKPSCE